MARRQPSQGKAQPVVCARLDKATVAEIDRRVAKHNRDHPDDQVKRGEWLRRAITAWVWPAREPDRRRLRGTG